MPFSDSKPHLWRCPVASLTRHLLICEAIFACLKAIFDLPRESPRLDSGKIHAWRHVELCGEGRFSLRVPSCVLPRIGAFDDFYLFFDMDSGLTATWIRSRSVKCRSIVRIAGAREALVPAARASRDGPQMNASAPLRWNPTHDSYDDR